MKEALNEGHWAAPTNLEIVRRYRLASCSCTTCLSSVLGRIGKIASYEELPSTNHRMDLALRIRLQTEQYIRILRSPYQENYHVLERDVPI